MEEVLAVPGAGDVAAAVAGLCLTHPLVVALPGAWLLAVAVSRLLDAPMDFLITRQGPEADTPAAAGPMLRDRSVVLVDDGQADASSWASALDALRRLQPGRLVIAVPRDSTLLQAA